MSNFNIKKIITNDEKEIIPKRINIIVGPNNSGKSRFLKDLKYILGYKNNSFKQENIVIKKIECNYPLSADDFIKNYNIEERIRINGSNSFIKNYCGVATKIELNNSLNNIIDNQNISLSRDWRGDIEREFKGIEDSFYIPDIDEVPVDAINIERINQGVIRYDCNGQHFEKIIGDTGQIIERNEPYNNFLNRFGKLFFQYLGTEEKLFMSKIQRRYGVDSNNINLLSEVSSHIEDVKELSNITKKLFNKYIYLDRISFGENVAFRVSEDFDFYEKLVLDDSKSENQLSKYGILDEEGDGIKNFVSSYLAIKSMNKDCILIDEPEAFLHPPLSRKFGEIIANEIKNNQQAFIVTHSEDIINGIVSVASSKQINIIHIERNKNINNIYVLPDNYLLSLKRRPIILMSNVLKGLFSKKVFITESFADSSLYHNLMMRNFSEYDYYFVNTQGKDKIGFILDFYSSLGINSVGIFDFDFFRTDETIKQCLYKRVDDSKKYEGYVEIFKNARNYLNEKAKLECKDKNVKLIKDDYYHKYGIDSIDDVELKSKLNNVIEEIKKYGIYVLKTGCLETSLKKVGIEYSKNNKERWIDVALEQVYKLNSQDIKKLDIVDLIKI